MPHSAATLKRHAALVDRMATALGVDLEEAALRGQVDTDQISDLVLTCTGCTSPEGCAHWLDAVAPGSAEHAPGYCRNADLLESLRPRD